MVLLQERRRDEIEAKRKNENEKLREDKERKIRQERVRFFINIRLDKKRRVKHAQG